MSLFAKMFEEARKSRNLVSDGMRVKVKMKEDDGGVINLSGKTAAVLTDVTPEGYAKALEGSEKVAVSRTSKFAKSTASGAFDVTGRFASAKYLEHEGNPAVAGQVVPKEGVA